MDPPCPLPVLVIMFLKSSSFCYTMNDFLKKAAYIEVYVDGVPFFPKMCSFKLGCIILTCIQDTQSRTSNLKFYSW